MNLPNKLTLLRMLIIPFFLFCMVARFENHYLWALVLFALASLTDMLDGRIARSRGLVSDFGRLMDPLADKLLCMSAMVCLISTGMVHEVLVVIVLAREFLVTSLRLVAAGKGMVLAADIWGKVKTVFQMSWICFDLLLLFLAPGDPLRTYPARREAVFGALYALHYLLLGGVVLFTLLSGMNYLWKNRSLFADV